MPNDRSILLITEERLGARVTQTPFSFSLSNDIPIDEYFHAWIAQLAAHYGAVEWSLDDPECIRVYIQKSDKNEGEEGQIQCAQFVRTTFEQMREEAL